MRVNKSRDKKLFFENSKKRDKKIKFNFPKNI